ncbi:MAG: hypothetical protein ACD_77C00420G0005 [uncultured bacterium]|nr:MAG: hypothetical protein ACD_77C00420G0005 [uncultured bacterium]HBY01003.1 diaminopimelate epimerase [Rikenellaceae bacterium]
MKITAYKYQSTGNDFVIIDNRDGSVALKEEQVKLLCDRRFGIGADGLMLLNSSKDNDFGMEFFNADGKPGTMCGNGGRALVAFAAHRGIKKFKFEAPDGIHNATVQSYSPTKCMVTLEILNVDEVKDYSPKSYYLNTGSPHLVIFVDNIQDYDVLGQGKLWRYHSHFPEGTNVDFVQGSWGRFNIPKFEEGQPQKITVRTYERGVEDETYSCGTGVVASSIAHHKLLTRNKFSYNKVEDNFPQTVKNLIETKGGDLEVEFTYVGNDKYSGIKLTGPSSFVFSCEIDV